MQATVQYHELVDETQKGVDFRQRYWSVVSA